MLHRESTALVYSISDPYKLSFLNEKTICLKELKGTVSAMQKMTMPGLQPVPFKAWFEIVIRV